MGSAPQVKRAAHRRMTRYLSVGRLAALAGESDTTRRQTPGIAFDILITSGYSSGTEGSWGRM